METWLNIKHYSWNRMCVQRNADSVKTIVYEKGNTSIIILYNNQT